MRFRGETLKRLRKSAGYSRNKLRELLRVYYATEISEEAVRLHERGAHVPRSPVLEAYAKLFRVPAEELLDRRCVPR